MNLRTLLGVVHSELLHPIEIIQSCLTPSIRQFKKHARILDTDTTIRRIVDTRCSVARFGDGEFYVMDGGGNGFQHPDERLRQRLTEVFTSHEPSLLVCVPFPWLDHTNLKHIVKVFFTRFLLNQHHYILPRIDYSREYGDAMFSRFYMDYADKRPCERRIGEIKKIWQGRDVVIVEGQLTRMGVGNDLFDGARSVRRILGPSKSAFDHYDEILSAIRQHVAKTPDTLLLLAMGMTATVLAYDLCRDGYQAIDIGHLDVEYEWMRMGAKDKVPLQNRFVNEANNYDAVAGCDDTEYTKQIIASIE